MEAAVSGVRDNEVLVEAIDRAGLTKFQDYLLQRRGDEIAKIAEGSNDDLSSRPSVDLLLEYVINGLYTCAYDVLSRFEYPKDITIKHF
ncbi:MAG: hypothetical protein AABW91_02705 [Nanoarchaeota archaeon]